MNVKSDTKLHLPEGLSPKEEADWWYEHRDQLFSEDGEYEVVQGAPVVPTADAHLRLPVWMIETLKREAAKTDFSYQWLIRVWLEERLKAEGIDPPTRDAMIDRQAKAS